MFYQFFSWLPIFVTYFHALLFYSVSYLGTEVHIFSHFHNLLKIDQKVTIFLYSFSSFLWMTYDFFISLNILVSVHLQFFEEFANVIVFYLVNVETDILAQKLPSLQHCHLMVNKLINKSWLILEISNNVLF